MLLLRSGLSLVLSDPCLPTWRSLEDIFLAGLKRRTLYSDCRPPALCVETVSRKGLCVLGHCHGIGDLRSVRSMPEPSAVIKSSKLWVCLQTCFLGTRGGAMSRIAWRKDNFSACSSFFIPCGIV
jgi:hypothetical protein